MKSIINRLSHEELLEFSAKHNSSVPIHIKAQLPRLLSLPREFDNAPITRSCTAILVSKTKETLAVMAANGNHSLRYYRSGRSVRYRLGDIKKYLNHQKLASADGGE